MLSPEDLRLAMLAVVERLRPIVILPESVVERTVTLHEKMSQIQDILKRGKGVSFRNLLHEARSKTEKIVCFLALLELVKQEEVNVSQASAFDDIVVNRLDREQQAA
jgi:segregation and condensation protein A